MENTAMIPADIQAYLAQLDKDAAKAKSGNNIYCPELRVVSTDKLSEDLLVAKGTFTFISKDSNDDRKFEPAWSSVPVVVLRRASQYVTYDEVEKKVIYHTNEFMYGDPVVVKNAEWTIVYKGDQSGLKAWGLKHLPDPQSKPDYPKHLLRWKQVWYVLIPEKYNPQDPVSCVYRLYMSASSLDDTKKWQESFKGDPIRFLTTLTTRKVDNGWVRFYPVVPTVTRELERAQLINYVTIKQELDQDMTQVMLEFCEGDVVEKTTPAPYVPPTPASYPPVPTTPVSPQTYYAPQNVIVAPPTTIVYESAVRTVSPVVPVPFDTPIQKPTTSQAEIDEVFGV